MHCSLAHLCALLALVGSAAAAVTVPTVDSLQLAAAATTAPATTAATSVIGVAAASPAAPLPAVVSYDNFDLVNVGAGDVGLEFSATPQSSSLGITPCNVNAADKNECIKGLFQQIAPLLKQNGISELNMASIDPYFYRRGLFRYANDGVQGGLLLKNMYIHGISTLKVNNVLSNFTENGFIIKLNVELPKLQADGQFKADVKFGGLRLVPKGPFNITIDNIRATILTDGRIENTEQGNKRVQLRRLNANVAVGETRIIANGIFTDHNLNAMILNLVNENLPEITRIGIPATREQWAPILVGHINDFFANVPIEKLLVQ